MYESLSFEATGDRSCSRAREATKLHHGEFHGKSSWQRVKSWSALLHGRLSVNPQSIRSLNSLLPWQRHLIDNLNQRADMQALSHLILLLRIKHKIEPSWKVKEKLLCIKLKVHQMCVFLKPYIIGKREMKSIYFNIPHLDMMKPMPRHSIMSELKKSPSGLKTQARHQSVRYIH